MYITSKIFVTLQRPNIPKEILLNSVIKDKGEFDEKEFMKAIIIHLKCLLGRVVRGLSRWEKRNFCFQAKHATL